MSREKEKKFIFSTVVVALVITVTLLFTFNAFGHDWYPTDCCSGKDCRPVPCSELKDTKDGVEYLGMIFKDLRTGMDELCHACYSATKTPHCIFFPKRVGF